MSYYVAIKNTYFLNNMYALNKKLESQRELNFNTGLPPCLTFNTDQTLYLSEPQLFHLKSGN